MARVEKLVDKMKRQPNGIKIEEAHKVLEYYGYRLDRKRGSHRQYVADNGSLPITIVERKPTIKAIYVNLILEIIGQSPYF